MFASSRWQRCIAMIKAIHAQENRTKAKKKAAFVVERLRQLKLKNAALLVVEGIEDTLSYYRFPTEHWRRIRTNNPLERIVGASKNQGGWLVSRRSRRAHVGRSSPSACVWLQVGHATLPRHGLASRPFSGGRLKGPRGPSPRIKSAKNGGHHRATLPA